MCYHEDNLKGVILLKKFILLIAIVLLLASCSVEESNSSTLPESVPESSSAEMSKSESAESSDSVPASEPSVSEESSAELVPASEVEIFCDQMVPALIETSPNPERMRYPEGETLFYSIYRDGAWGLVDENGTEWLPCNASQELELCMKDEWIWLQSGPIDEDWETLNATVEEATGFSLCYGHGNSGITFMIDAENPDTLQSFHTMEGAASLKPTEPDEIPTDSYFPVFYGTLENEEEIPELSHDGYWNFCNVDGTLLAEGMEFDRVGWFNGEALVPVCQDEKWAYLSADGQLVTDFVYDNCWGSSLVFNPDTQEYEQVSRYYAYNMAGGYVPVCKDGKWGVLDANGTEIVPCQYEGAAPYPGGAWLAEDGVWKLFLFE